VSAAGVHLNPKKISRTTRSRAHTPHTRTESIRRRGGGGGGADHGTGDRDLAEEKEDRSAICTYPASSLVHALNPRAIALLAMPTMPARLMDRHPDDRHATYHDPGVIVIADGALH